MPASSSEAARSFFEKPARRELATSRVSMRRLDLVRGERGDEAGLRGVFVADGEEAFGHAPKIVIPA